MKNYFILVILLTAGSILAQKDDKALEIINASILATGGKEKMTSIKSMVRMAEISLPFGVSESETYVKNEKFYSKSTMNGQVGFEQKYDGTRMYMGGMQGTQIIDDEKQIARMSKQFKIFPLLDMESGDASLIYKGIEKIKGKDYHKIISKSDDQESSLYFEVATNLLSRMVSQNEMQGNKVESVIDLSDYKEVDGLLVAHKMGINTGQFQMDMKTKQIKLNVDIPDKTFMIE